VPRCDQDHPLKPDVVLFGEFLPEGALERAFSLAAGADVLLCIGSSLEVYPIAQLPAADPPGRRRRGDHHGGGDPVRRPGDGEAHRRRGRRARSARRRPA
jgi:NAD-dependent SIR2 family protein deacetylase